jgi:hypothetical protein
LIFSDEDETAVMLLLLLLLLPPTDPMREIADKGSLRADNGSNSTTVLVVEEDIAVTDDTAVVGSTAADPFDFTVLDVADFCNGCTVVGSVVAEIRCLSAS